MCPSTPLRSVPPARGGALGNPRWERRLAKEQAAVHEALHRA
ncbi:hypothetical protein [Nonomuraea sp. B1E8]